VVVITSNNEKELPDAFLRRCVFHFIEFPDPELMRRIVAVHLPTLDEELVAQAIRIFYEVRKVPGLRKRPSTSELIDWLAVLSAAGLKTLKVERDLPFGGALLKKEQDVATFASEIARGRRLLG
jgi:MoxR-like ATPase